MDLCKPRSDTLSNTLWDTVCTPQNTNADVIWLMDFDLGKWRHKWNTKLTHFQIEPLISALSEGWADVIQRSTYPTTDQLQFYLKFYLCYIGSIVILTKIDKKNSLTSHCLTTFAAIGYFWIIRIENPDPELVKLSSNSLQTQKCPNNL